MIKIKYEIQHEDLLGGRTIEERTFTTDDLQLAVRICVALKDSDDVKYIEVKSV